MSEGINAEFAEALALATSEVQNPKKDSQNPHFRNRYASLEEVVYVVRTVLQKHGLVLLQHPGVYKDGTVELHSTIIHKSGHTMTWTMSVPVSKQDAQQVGSAITYARRYSLLSLFCLAAEDDDGEGAVGRGGASPVKAISGMSAQELRLVAAAVKARADELGIQKSGQQGPTPLEQQLKSSLKPENQ